MLNWVSLNWYWLNWPPTPVELIAPQPVWPKPRLNAIVTNGDLSQIVLL